MKCTLRLFVPVVLNVQFSVSVRRKILRRLNNNSIMRVNVNILVIVLPFTKFSTVEDAEEGPVSPLIWGKKKRKKERKTGRHAGQTKNKPPPAFSPQTKAYKRFLNYSRFTFYCSNHISIYHLLLA